MKQIYYAIQNIIRGKNSNLVKVISISCGLLVAIILFAKIAFELSYDTCFPNSDRLYVIKTAWNKEEKFYAGNTLYPVAETIAKHFPEQVENATTWDYMHCKIGNGTKKQEEMYFTVDSTFFQTFEIPLLRGNVQDLNQPDVFFISESFAKEMFGEEDPIGKTLYYNRLDLENLPFIVKGVYKDIPENTTMYRPRVILSEKHKLKYYNSSGSWYTGGNYYAHVKLHKNQSPDIINEKINPIIDRYFPKERYRIDYTPAVEIAPIEKEHLLNEEAQNKLLIMTLLAFALLATATFNYILISISSLAYRAKAVGVHKCSGAGQNSIFSMFMWETAFIIVLSLVLILFIMLNNIDVIEELTEVSFASLFSWQNLWAPALVVLSLFLAGGIMPGLFYSSIPVTQVFKQYTESKRRWKYPLLFIQFAGVAFMFGLTYLMYDQYHYTTHKDLGYDISNVAQVSESDDGRRENLLAFLRNAPYIADVATSEQSLMDGRARYPIPAGANNLEFTPRHNVFDPHYFDFIGLKLKAGKIPTSENEIIVNEEFVKAMGWADDGVGEFVPEHGTVVGIMEGYIRSYDVAQMEPWEFRFSNQSQWCIQVRIKEPFSENLAKLNEDMKALYPNEELAFVSSLKKMENLYHSRRTFRDSTILSTIAVIAIALMGLIGYSNDEVRRRSKEIAIRKINGAEVADILKMLSQDIIRIALPAIIIGLVFASHAGAVWKEQFKDIHPVNNWIYVVLFFLVLLFILGVVIAKAWRIANENPVNSIKSE